MLCSFPAKELLAYRRRVARLADETSDPTMVRNYAQNALLVEQLRLAHEDICCCNGWYDAVDAAKGELVAR